ncbi:ATP-dependent Clp protease ATP-binding subunit ClpA [bacterium MnTg02]|nr:ATP-dependent Clp protease ATP-binding subunit ClpA [bacterium MnTg02]
MSQSLADILGWVQKSENLQFSLERALTCAQERSHREVTLEHLLFTLADDPIAAAFLEVCDADVMQIRSDALTYIDDQLKSVSGANSSAPAASDGLTRVMAHASAAAEQSRRPLIDGAIVLAALIGDGESQAAKILKSHGLTFEVAIDRLRLKPGQEGPDARPQPSGDNSTEELRPQKEAKVPEPASPSQKTGAEGQGGRRVKVAKRAPNDAKEVVAESGSGSQAKPSASTPSGEKTKLRSGPSVDEIESSVRELVEEQRKDALRSPSESGGSEPDHSAPSPQSADSSVDPHPVPGPLAIPSMQTRAAPAVPSPAVSSKHPHAATSGGPAAADSAGQRQRAGVSQWPFAWQQAPGARSAASPPIADATPGPVPVERTRSTAAASLGPAPSQDNWTEGQFGGQAKARKTVPLEPVPVAGRPSPGHDSEPSLPVEDLAGAHDSHTSPERPDGADPSRLSETIPRKMRVMAPQPVEVFVKRVDIEDIGGSDEDAWQLGRRQAFVTEAVTVQLKAPDGGFLIENETPDTQWIDYRLGLIHEDLTGWRWTVTPTQSGRTRLQLIVSARTVSEQGTVAESVLPEQIVNVKVGKNYLGIIGQFTGWVIVAAIGGVLARYGENVTEKAFEIGRQILEIVQ